MLPQDLQTDILLRLPIKSLLRFKSVSKHWRSLISSPDFRRRHHASTTIILSQLTTDTIIHHTSLHGGGISDSPPFTSLSFIDDSAGVRIVQSSHGLLLCRSVHKLGKSQSLYICNPSTHQYTVVPERYADDVLSCKPLTLYGAYLVLDSSNSPHYQIVSVRKCLCSVCTPSSSSYTNISYQIVVYSSDTRVWKHCGSAFNTPGDMAVDNGVVWNGAIHWISATGASLCFDIDLQGLRTMPSLPFTENWSRRRMRYFGESCGHLYLIEVYGSAIEFQVFEMEKDYSSWVPKYNVNLAPIVDAFPEMIRSYPDASESIFNVFSLLCVQDDEEGSFLLLQIPGEFLSYNLRDKTFKKLGPISKETNVASLVGCFEAFQFVETLAGV